MADQRSAFRFRLPWLPPQPQPQPPSRPTIAPRPVAPAAILPRLPTREANPVPIPTNTSPPPQPALETQIPSRTPIQAPPQTEEINVPTQIPTPPPQPSGETETPAQPPITTISTPVTPPQSVESPDTIQPPEISSADPNARTPVIPLEQAPPEAPLLPAKVTTSESQPLSPSRATTQSQVPSQPSSPSRDAAPPRIVSQPPSPSRAAAPTRVRSQPPSPSRATAQPRVPSQPSSPSRSAAPSGGVISQPSSPSRSAAPSGGVTSQPSSPSRATTQSQTSSKPSTSTRAISSPSRAVPQRRTITPPSTPSRISSQPPSTPETASQPQYGSFLTSDSAGQTSGSVRVSSSRPPEEYKPLSETITEQERLQPSYTSPKSPSPSDKEQDKKYNKLDSMKQTYRQLPDERGTTNVESQSKHFPQDLKPEETKEVKEVLKEIKDNDTVAVSDIQAKEETHESVGGKKVNQTSSSNGKETKNTSHGRNKTMVGADPHYPKHVTSNTTHIPRHKEIKDDITKLVHKMSTEDPKNSTTDKPVSVITLAGENRGASMQLGFGSSKQRGAIQIRRGYKIKPDENENEEGNLKDKIKDTKSIEDQAREGYVNSNIQGINNSIMFESYISERNPGVHIIHSQYTKETRKQDFHEKQNGKSHMVHHAQKMAHNPMVKRRCLRGLFLESSDSDSDDPSKPKRHGCRVECSKKSEDNNSNNLL